MPRFGPVRREGLIRRLRQLGFASPYVGGRHQFMVGRGVRLRIPNPYRGDVGRELLGRLLRQAGVTREEWEEL